MRTLVAGLIMFGALVAAVPHREMEAGVFKTAPHNWTPVRRASPEEKLMLTIAVKQQNLDTLTEVLYAVSDPISPEYGKHLTLEEVHDLVAPTSESVEKVVAWMLHHNIPESDIVYSPNSDFIRAPITVKTAEQMLNTHYFEYAHPDAADSITRVAGPYSIPVDVAAHVDFIAPTIRFPRVSSVKVALPKEPKGLFNTPSSLRQLYQVPDNLTGTDPNNVQAIASFLEQYWTDSDLQTFFKQLQPSSVGHTVAKVIGPNQGAAGTEASLDIQYIMSMGAGVTTWAYYTAGRAPTNPQNEPFLEWMLNVTADPSPPNVLSVSYGEDEKSVGFDYASRINVEFQKAGVRGVSILVASGDSGTGGNCSASGNRFNPDFPSGSPWITAVGGLTGGTAGSTPTGEVTDYISGGGFSDWWPTPDYQSQAVSNYISTAQGLPPTAVWNQSGRGYPDVSAQSEGFVIVQYGITLPGVGGTSCAAPTFSGVVSLLNDLRTSKGKSPLGFLNPLLYRIGADKQYVNALNDAISGYNAGCSGNGFPAQAGWDPATGWGSPNYRLLAAIVQNLP